jgi:hypothetical protein
VYPGCLHCHEPESKVRLPRMTAETAAVIVIRAECVVRYTLPTPIRTPLTTATKAAVPGLPFSGAGPGGTAGTGVGLSNIAPRGQRRAEARLCSCGARGAGTHAVRSPLVTSAVQPVCCQTSVQHQGLAIHRCAV